ncbi:MAG TPA: RICIN domain-containing protein [Verrucomicrobiae bacterium]
MDVLTQHNDQYRTGANLSETALTLSNVNSNQFGKLFSYYVDGYVFAQPLYVSALSIGGGTHNVCYVATMEDSVYAFDADSNLTYWHQQFTGGAIVPVPIVDITGNNNLNIHGNVGILSTPVIDKVSGTIYVLARTKNTSTTTYLQTLHALDLATGAEKFGGPKVITATGFDPKMQNQRPGLALANGNIYIAWGSHEDITPYHGWVMAYNATNLAQVAVFNTTPGGSQSAIWMAGQAPAIDTSGNTYWITGNGDWDGVNKWGESLLKLTPALTVSDWFTPTNYATLNAGDQDFGAGGAMLLPGAAGYPSTSYVIGGGKEGKIFVLDKTSGALGHLSANDSAAHQIFQATASASCSKHIHGTPVYWNSGTQGQMIYVWGENDYGKSFKFNGSTFTTNAFTHTTVTSPTTGCGMPGSILSVSANGNTNGIIWANCVYTGDAVHDIVPGVLRAYDANDLGKELWNSRINLARDDSGLLAKYTPPTVANGKVYLSSFSGVVNVYGLIGTNQMANGTYKLINRNSGLALDATGQNTNNGTLLEQYTYNAGTNQRWSVTGLGGGVYKIIGVQSGRSLDVTGQSTADGAAIELYDYNGGGNQQWVILPTSAGYYTVQGVQSGKLMEVFSSATTNSASIDQWTGNGGNNQQWNFQAP